MYRSTDSKKPVQSSDKTINVHYRNPNLESFESSALNLVYQERAHAGSTPTNPSNSNRRTQMEQSIYYTAVDKSPYLDGEADPIFIDLDKDLDPEKAQNCIFTPKNVEGTLPTARRLFQSPHSYNDTPTTSKRDKSKDRSTQNSEDLSYFDANDPIYDELTDDWKMPYMLSDLVNNEATLNDIGWVRDNKFPNILELFDRKLKNDHEKYRRLMQEKNDSGKFATINLDTLDHEALFVDLDTEVRQLPSCDVSKAIDWLIRAEIKNELYEIINQDRNNSRKIPFNIESDAKKTVFVPDEGGNIEILSYLGMTGKNKDGTRTRRQRPCPEKSNQETSPEMEPTEMSPTSEATNTSTAHSFTIQNTTFDNQAGHISGEASFTFNESSGPTPLSRWGNMDNLNISKDGTFETSTPNESFVDQSLNNSSPEQIPLTKWDNLSDLAGTP